MLDQVTARRRRISGEIGEIFYWGNFLVVVAVYDLLVANVIAGSITRTCTSSTSMNAIPFAIIPCASEKRVQALFHNFEMTCVRSIRGLRKSPSGGSTVY